VFWLMLYFVQVIEKGSCRKIGKKIVMCDNKSDFDSNYY
jgi:hypothetical protein